MGTGLAIEIVDVFSTSKTSGEENTNYRNSIDKIFPLHASARVHTPMIVDVPDRSEISSTAVRVSTLS